MEFTDCINNNWYGNVPNSNKHGSTDMIGEGCNTYLWAKGSLQANRPWVALIIKQRCY